MAHIHDVFDSDVHFSIDHISRAIKNETSNAKTKIVQYDHNSERFTFELQRYIDGHDMSTCNVVQVHYINIGTGNNKANGLYEVNDLQVSPEDENVVICSWLISQNATQFVGSLNFVLRFICTTDDVLDYVWNTAIYNAISVVESISNSEVIVEQNEDVLVQWRQELFAVSAEGVNNIATAKEQAIAEINSTKTEAVLELMDSVETATAAAREASEAKESAEQLAEGAEKAKNEAIAAAERAEAGAVKVEAIEATANEAKRNVDALREVVSKFHSNIVDGSEGEHISISDSSDMELAGLTLYGKTIQNGTPTPEAPIPLESVGDNGSVAVTVCGKNLLDLRNGYSGTGQGVKFTSNLDGSYNRVGTATGNAGNVWFKGNWSLAPNGNNVLLTLLPGKMYYIKDCFLSTLRNDGVTGTTYVDSCNYTVNAEQYPDGFKVTGVRCPTMETGATYNDTIHPAVYLSSNDMEWEPYKGGSVTVSLPNGLPGIPVSSGGNYTDESGQMWICDEIDFARGKYVQRIGEATYDGSADEAWQLANTASGSARFTIMTPGIKNNASGAVAKILNSHFPIVTADSIYVHDAEGCAGNLAGLIIHTKQMQTLEAWKAHLANKPMTAVYELATPIETDLTAEEIAQYSTLHTNYPNTTVYNDEGAGMGVKYVADTKLYIDKKFAELASAIVNN